MSKMKDNIIELVDKKLRQKFGKEIKGIILYGSRARGDNKADSDYDFVVLCENNEQQTKSGI